MSIFLNRLIPHIGSVLAKKSLIGQFPLTKTLDLEIKKPSKPERLILSFSTSAGFYNGKIVIKNGDLEAGRCELPFRVEYTNKTLGFYNEDISRQSNVIIISIQNYKADCPLTLDLNLNLNVRDPILRKKLDSDDQGEIKIEVRG